jgi:hypothetical protein
VSQGRPSSPTAPAHANAHAWYLAEHQATRALKFVRILRLIKVVNMLRTSALIKRIKHAMGPGALRIACMLLTAAFIAHTLACFFFYSAAIEVRGRVANGSTRKALGSGALLYALHASEWCIYFRASRGLNVVGTTSSHVVPACSKGAFHH